MITGAWKGHKLCFRMIEACKFDQFDNIMRLGKVNGTIESNKFVLNVEAKKCLNL